MPPILWHRPVRDGVANALNKIFVEGFYADKVIHFALRENKKWGSRDRRLFAESVYDMVRWWRKLWVMGGFVWDDNLAPPNAQQIQRVIDVWSEHHGEHDGELASFRTGKGFAADQSVPDWLYELGLRELGEKKWQQILCEMNHQAPVFLRTNLLKTTPAKLVFQLNSEGFQASEEKAVPGAVRLLERANVFKSKVFLEGHFEVQDLNSQKVAGWLKVEPGQRVIDACAGAGGKTLNLASLMQNRGKILAMDISEKKLEELRKRVRRAGAAMVEVRAIESSKTIKRLKETADRVLLDVPCSGVGVLRRNPDSKWKLKPTEIPSLIKVQEEILSSYSTMLKPGGVLLYATCSIFPSENEQQIEKFISQNGNSWQCEEQQTFYPSLKSGDGFFVSRLKRNE